MTTYLRDRDIAIVGYAECKNVRRSGRTALAFAADAVGLLLQRTGIERADIDGFAATLALSEAGNPFWTNLLAETLGLSQSWSQATDIGGASSIGNIARAAAAIHAGYCDTVLCLAADAASTRDTSDQSGSRAEFLDPSGYAGPVTVFGLLSSAYRHRYGLPERALAKLAVTQRKGALRNPNACEALRIPLTEEEYLRSRLVADPLRLLDCVMLCDGASAFLVTSTEHARKRGMRVLAHPTAYREITNFDPRQEIDDITVSGFSVVGPAALRDAGLRPDDVRMFQAYDDFLIAVILQLEQIGFVGVGGGGDFILGQDVGFGGNFPINTGGGQVSCGQAGLAGGGVNLAEAVRQLCGEAGERQIADTRNALVTGIGAMQYARNWGTSAALVLEAGS